MHFGTRIPSKLTGTRGVESFLWIEGFSSLDHHQFRDLCPEFFKCRWLGTNERVVNVRYHTCFVRLTHKQTSLQFAAFETHLLCEYSSQEFCKVTASCPHAVHRAMQSPDPTIALLPLFGGQAYVSEELSACMTAHTRSPVSIRRSNDAAYSKSPHTDNGDGVGANTSSLTVVAKTFSTHLDLTSLPFIRRAQPVSKIAPSGGTSVSLNQEYSCRSFICWISRSSPALTLSARSPSINPPS